MSAATEKRILTPDWVYDCLEDKTPKRKFWITKGLGSGGTFGGVWWHLALCRINKHSPRSWAIAPTYQQVQDTLIPTFTAVLNEIFGHKEGKDYELVKTGFPRIELKRTNQEILFKSANRPDRFVGPSISHALMTEPGLIGREAFEKSSVRIRCPKASRLQAMFEGTPEGLGNWYEQEANFEGEFNEAKNYRRITLWTEDNPHLDNYADTVKQTYSYDPFKLESYLYGRFVPFTKGNAYWEFAHSRNVKLDVKPSEQSTITMTWDWNHTPLAWVALQKRTVWTLSGQYTRYEVSGESSGKSKGIMDACAEFIAQYPPERYKNTPIEIDGGCDGYAQSHLSSLCAFDQVIQVLKKYYNNVRVVAERSAPRIEHRLQRHNALLAYSYLIVAAWCRNTIKSHETTNLKPNTWDIDKPKNDLFSHWGDALGYAIFRLTKGLDLEQNDGKHRKIYGTN
jgi:hypothetical protein